MEERTERLEGGLEPWTDCTNNWYSSGVTRPNHHHERRIWLKQPANLALVLLNRKTGRERPAAAAFRGLGSLPGVAWICLSPSQVPTCPACRPIYLRYIAISYLLTRRYVQLPGTKLCTC